MYYIMLLLRGYPSAVLIFQWCWLIFKVIFKARKVHLDLCYLFRPIFHKRCMLWPMFVSTYTKSYKIFQLTLWPLINFKGQIKVTDLSRGVSHKWCIIWSKFVWNTYSKSYMAFQFTLQHSILTFDEIERANQGHWVFSGIYFIS